MFCKINSGAISALSAYPVSVESDISNGLPDFSMVGLLSSEVREAKERVRTAIRNSGFTVPPKRITINLSPADIRKEGAFFDLPIAIAILVSIGVIPLENVKCSMFLGELSLDGSVKNVNGILSITIMAKENGMHRIFVPKDNSREGAVIKGIEVVGVASLSEIIEMLNNPDMILPEFVDYHEALYIEETESELDFKDICGQNAARRATEIAVAGMHNILYIGPPGSGKSMMANRIPTILPRLNLDEIIEITKIYSALGLLKTKDIMKTPPFRAPHHSITAQGLAGGGKYPTPGEITMAHKGVLFLDELPEFSRKALETLRLPMENHKILINRDNSAYEFPADFMFVAAMNPCSCGYYPDKNKCNCTTYNIDRYLNKVKGALLDRIDICVQTTKVEINELQNKSINESSKEIRKRVENAWALQKERYKNSNIVFNCRLEPGNIKKYCKLGEDEIDLISKTYKKLDISTRVYHSIIKVARTIADLDDEININRKHLLEAVAYRNVMLNE